MATNVQSTTSSSVGKSILAGVIAGLGGGLVFGAMMGVMDMLPMIAMLAGQEDPGVGFIIHMIISAFIGGVYGLLVHRFPATVRTAVIGGVLNGIVWWMLGALLLMPLMLGMMAMVLQIGQPQLMSLIGHLIYGIITGLLYNPLRQRL